MTCPVEKIVAGGLEAAGVWYKRGDTLEAHLDFYLPGLDIWIECKQFHTDRIAEQTARVKNVIVIQGMDAARFFASALARELAPVTP